VKLPNVVLSPHLGAATVEAQEMVAVDVAKQIVDVLSGGPVVNAVNYPAVDPALLPKLRPFMELAQHLGSALSQILGDEPIRELRVLYAGTSPTIRRGRSHSRRCAGSCSARRT